MRWIRIVNRFQLKYHVDKGRDVKMRNLLVALVVSGIFFVTGLSYAQGSARALFVDEGAAVSSSLPAKQSESENKKAGPASKYVGLSYQIFEVQADGRQKAVTNKKIFKSGDQIRLTLKSNRAGHMAVLNVGPTGDVTTLFKDRVEPYKTVTIPAKGTLRFSGPSGIESVVALFSNKPYAGDAAAMYSECVKTKPSDTRNLVVDDSMSNQYSVISTGGGCKPAKGATRNLVVESHEGNNYGVMPDKVLGADSVMALNIKLQHQ